MSISILFRLKFVWRLHSTIFELIKLLQICRYISIAVLFLTKSSRRTSSQHLPFQSLNSNTRVRHERCSRFIKITTKTKANCCSTLARFEQTLHLFLSIFMVVSQPPLYWLYFNAVSFTYSWFCQPRHCKEQLQSYFKKCEIVFSRKQQGAMRTDWKNYPCIFYRFSIGTL